MLDPERCYGPISSNGFWTSKRQRSIRLGLIVPYHGMLHIRLYASLLRVDSYFHRIVDGSTPPVKTRDPKQVFTKDRYRFTGTRIFNNRTGDGRILVVSVKGGRVQRESSLMANTTLRGAKAIHGANPQV